MQTKFFVGTRFTPELKAHVGEVSPPITTIRYEGKEYIGTYHESSSPTIQEIRTSCDTFLLNLQEHCPDHRIDNLPVVVFPQLFVG